MHNKAKKVIASNLAILSLLSSPSISTAMWNGSNPSSTSTGDIKNADYVDIVSHVENMDDSQLSKYLENQRSEFYSIGGSSFKLCDSMNTMNPRVQAVVIGQINVILKRFPSIVKKSLLVDSGLIVSFNSEHDGPVGAVFLASGDSHLLLQTSYYNDPKKCFLPVESLTVYQRGLQNIISHEMGHVIACMLSIINKTDVDSQSAALKSKILEHAGKYKPGISRVCESPAGNYGELHVSEWVAEACAHYFTSMFVSTKNSPTLVAFRECLDEIDQSFSQSESTEA